MSRNEPTGIVEDAAIALQYEITTIVREEIGMNETFASQVAEALVRGLRKRLGGQKVYIPVVDTKLRDLAIRSEFNGRNRDEICRRYGIRKSQLYEIVSRGKDFPVFGEETGMTRG